MPGSAKSVGYSISTVELLLCDLWEPWEPSSSRYLLSWRQQDVGFFSQILSQSGSFLPFLAAREAKPKRHAICLLAVSRPLMFHMQKPHTVV